MSKFKTTALAAALALAVCGTAQADGNVTATNSNFALNVTGGASPNPTANTGSVAFNVAAPDILIGRHAGTGQVTVEATLVGAKINELLKANISTPSEMCDADADVATADVECGAIINTVSATPGNSSFQFTMTPPLQAVGGFQPGDMFTISGMKLQDAAALADAGGQVTIAFTIKDTTTGTVLSSATAKAVLTSVEATKTTITAGDANTVDVLQYAKKKFEGNTVGATLGTVKAERLDVSADGTGATANVDGSNKFQFDAGDDLIKLTLKVPYPGAFAGAGMFYADVAACGTAPTLDSDTVKFVQDGADATKFTASVPVTANTGATYNVCAVANDTTVIEAQTIGLTAQIDLVGALTKDPASVTENAFNVLKYNGAVAKVWHFNPASNADQVSYLRLTNTSTTDGKVTIDATCDDGTAAPTAAVITSLGAGKSILLTSRDVEQGNSAKQITGTGACAVGGKVRLVLTGEFASMQVQNFLRNNTSAGTINTNVNIEDNNQAPVN